MGNSALLETIAVFAIVAIALVYVLWRVIKTSRGNNDCGCGCGKNCKSKQNGKKWDE